MLLSTYTPLMNKKEIYCWENRPFEKVWPENLQQKKSDITKTKKKRVRSAFTTNQLQVLEETFSRQKYITSELRTELAKTLNIKSKCIIIWFQNRRMKAKKESSISSSDSSSETIGIESPSPTHSTSALPTVQVDNDEPTTERYPHYTDNSYQLPTYHNTNEAQTVYKGMTPPDFASYFDSSSETVGIESPSPTHSASAIPTVQAVIDEPTTERLPHYTDNSYQLPTYHNTNEAQSVFKGMNPPDCAKYFNSENTACPTQYYPYNINHTNEKGNRYNQYGSEINNWTSNQYPYNLLH